MFSTHVLCPLCSHFNFGNVDSLRIRLITAANGPVSCPQCSEICLGLDKLTIHLFSHSTLLSDNNDSQKNTKINLLQTSNIPVDSILLIDSNQQDVSFTTMAVEEGYSKLKHLNTLDLLKKSCDSFEKKNETKQAASEVEIYESNSESVDGGGKDFYSSILKMSEKSESMSEHPYPNEKSTNDSILPILDKLHKSAKPWQCDTCTKCFTTKYFLRKHKRLHTGEMPYCCGICGRKFTFQQSYHKHLLYHSDEKPYKCIICNRAFKELSTLHNHERIHSGEKPYTCEICGKSFRQRVSFLVHTRIHTGVMPYKCPDCQQNFRYKLSLRTHKCKSSAAESERTALDRHAKNSTESEITDLNFEYRFKMPEASFSGHGATYETHNYFCSNLIDDNNINMKTSNGRGSVPEGCKVYPPLKSLQVYSVPADNMSMLSIADTYFSQCLDEV